jgi:DEAD/DEAH box helicase domain-containing protein
MAKLQAATVSNQIVRKRKKKAKDNGSEDETVDSRTGSEQPAGPEEPFGTISTTTTMPTKTQDGGPRPRKAAKKNIDGTPALLRKNSSAMVESSIPWPPHFTQLTQLHRALNLVYTFCSTRRHFATTFENIKGAVEGHIKRELKTEEIAQVKTLIPRAINFSYVDETMLQINLMGVEDNPSGKRSKEFIIQDPIKETDIGDHKEVLFFEFVDGDLKRQVQNPKTGEPTKVGVQKLRNEKLKMPVFSQKQMMGLIEKRNGKFTSAVNGFLNQCFEDKMDPVMLLVDQSKQFVPTMSESRGNTPGPDRSAPLPSYIPKERKAITEIVSEIKSQEWYTGQIVPDGHRVFDPQEPIYGELNFQLSQGLVNALYNTRSITQLYAHQAEAINNLYDGHNVIVSTSTSSGKSLIYQIPVLHELEKDHETRAMYIFPTKALAQDQRRSLKDLLHYVDGLQNMVIETFDGDTPMEERHNIRDEARIIFTNPDMLHITILPQEEAWRTFLQNLKFVVVDELHVYNGLFGSHVALIMRRLRRICAAVGNRHVKFISCSATVANPEEHMKTIFGVEDVKLTDFDGSPSGRKEFLCWNTPFKDPKDSTSGRGDAMAEAARLFCQLVLRGIRVIAFCRIRKQCEVLLSAIKIELGSLERTEVMSRVMSYRGGYTPSDRRQIEKEMFEGKLVGIVATNALELGIDIGSLDAVMTCGFPYTISNLRQQSGRAGRRNKDSLSVLVGDCFPTDQYYMENPDEIFTKPNCELQVDLENMLVLEGHIQCAAHEMPIRPDDDTRYFGCLLPSIAEERMRKDKLGFYHCNPRFLPRPSNFVAIRDTEDDHFAIIDTTHGRNVVLEELEASRAFFTLYDGGIFLHQGNTYLIKEFSQEKMMAKVELVKVDWTTQQRDYTDIDPVETELIRKIPGSRSKAFFGPICIKQVVFGFFKVDKRKRVLDAVQVDNPPIILFSKGMWLDIPKLALDILNSRRLNIAGAIHAAEHAILSLMPNFVISMPGDVRTECKNAQKEFAKKETTRKRPARLTFYDAKGGPHGSGISTKAFEFIDLLLKQACKRVDACCCLEGCLECCCDERCKQSNNVISKAGAGVVLKSLLGLEIDVDSLPWGEEEIMPAGIETVVIATEVRGAEGKRIEEIEVVREGNVAGALRDRNRSPAEEEEKEVEAVERTNVVGAPKEPAQPHEEDDDEDLDALEAMREMG